ncbi:UNVERIFIED_CONTAM: hypothetical protein FKN15_018532 [Acipenser sinensis]
MDVRVKKEEEDECPISQLQTMPGTLVETAPPDPVTETQPAVPIKTEREELPLSTGEAEATMQAAESKTPKRRKKRKPVAASKTVYRCDLCEKNIKHLTSFQ